MDWVSKIGFLGPEIILVTANGNCRLPTDKNIAVCRRQSMTAKTAMEFYVKYQEKQQISHGKRKFDCEFHIFCLKKP